MNTARNECSPTPQPMLQRIDTRNTTLGQGISIRRAIPTRALRMIGAWCFLDHVGPLAFEAGHGMTVGPHPHIGLQTFTWMIEGEIFHQDSLGYEQWIRLGQVNLMTAGNGITHAETSPTDKAGRVHAAQLWIALPDAHRHDAPAFQHYPELPQQHINGFHLTLLVGSLFEQTSPVKVHTPLLGIDITAATAAHTTLPLDPKFEHGLLILDGQAHVEGELLQPGTLLYLGVGRHIIEIRSESPVRMLLIGGKPFEEDVLLWWNFVARTQTEIETACQDWNAHRHFKEVPSTILERLVAPDTAGIQLKAGK